jgi:hypothetical protein
MPITTETIPVSAFNKMWISSTLINLKDSGGIFTRLQPYDGKYLLSKTTSTSIRNLSAVRVSDPSLDTMLVNLESECRRQANEPTAKLETVVVTAPSPTLPVTASIIFKDKPVYGIRDCFNLASTDSTFGAVFYTTMAKIAEKSGYTFTP